jgi:hypothetical protein
MKKQAISSVLILLTTVFLSQSLYSQGSDAAKDTLRKGAVNFFIDCIFCDMNYIRQEIPYVNYVRDVREAEVYLLVTRQDAGSGGRQYTFMFQGNDKYLGMNDTLYYTSNPDETTTIIREKRTKMIKMGLMRYVAKTPLYNEIEIGHNRDLEQEEVIDRWNNWVFEISIEPMFQSEEANKELNLRTSLNITKITEEIKLEVEMDNFYNRETFIEYANTDSAETTTYIRSSRSIDNLFVKSLGDHWSAGLKWDLGSSTRENYDFTTEFLPSVEYDIFPYSESTHRQLRILYGAGVQYNNYIDTTVYNQTTETLGKQSLNVAFQIQKKWGSINLALEGSNYFNDFSKNRLELFTDIRIRIFKGLSIEIGGSIAHINDQVNLKKGDVTEAERLLKLTELATKYRIEGGIELTYTFGSIYNNIVNPRFGNGRRF